MASLLDRMVVGVLPAIPKPIVRHFSRPYIAGAHVQDAIRTVRSLIDEGALTTLDILGEHIYREEEADRAMQGYLSLMETIRRENLATHISVKLSQLGLKLDPTNCLARIDRVVSQAEQMGGIFVRLDMEDSSCTDDTLEIHRRLKAKHDNVGIVIQAMLRRSRRDVEGLAAIKANVRLCKGIYVEPWEIAYQDREIVRRNFTNLLGMLLDAGCYVGIATHDESLVFDAEWLIQRHRLDHEQYEFQMLLGVEEKLRRMIIRAGHRLRVYVPFGEQWYAYSVRRLKENPHMAGTIAKAAFGLK